MSGRTSLEVGRSSFEKPSLDFVFGGFNAGSGSADPSGFNARSGDMTSGAMSGDCSFGEERPLLEELEIHPHQIWQKTVSVLHPFREYDQAIVNDADLAGPLVFCLLLGIALLLNGKIHFGYIYGLGVIGCFGMYVVMNLMSETGVDFDKTVSILGYCFLPIVLLAALSTFVSVRSSVPEFQVLAYLATTLCVAWATYSAASMFVTSCQMVHQRWLVAYPVALLYICFAIITVF
eukprot:gnl/Hemi2/19056_TR6311_c0_g2_i1.p1 gnl/Hemi2/19056_TR6311_c0_g2~~gnl/Hemi2/19056_TR6311_c0_g2_i1.p1  ORF type:complete len:250 (-),score=31.86 gnl/Hemi2/19056_TR6311_c0_g2_i1:27-728(-)